MSEFACGSCGELLRSGVLVCPKCGSRNITMDGLTGKQIALKEESERRQEEEDDNEEER